MIHSSAGIAISYRYFTPEIVFVDNLPKETFGQSAGNSCCTFSL